MSRGMSESELQSLCNALSTQGESEADGVKFIYMDDNTVYRFENNRMKKVSATMIKKANKLIASQNSYPNQQPATPQQPTRKRKQQPQLQPQQSQLQLPQQADDDEYDDDEEVATTPIPVQPAKKSRRKNNNATANANASNASTIDLNEYWQVKNRNEYMNAEITRLNNKVNKLKQYKQIVNKITGNEYDAYIPDQQPMQQQEAALPSQ